MSPNVGCFQNLGDLLSSVVGVSSMSFLLMFPFLLFPFLLFPFLLPPFLLASVLSRPMMFLGEYRFVYIFTL